MAGYLSRLQITLDEEDALLQDDGTIVDGIGTNEPVSTVIEVGTAISAQDADDEIQEEAVSIESDLEAMQEGVDAVTELKEQNDVHQELLEQPEIISPEVAVTTQDAFVITLAKLKITPEMAFQSRLSLDSCAKDPVRIVRVTHDGVKEFLNRIKEHIMAFFRTVKKKVMKLIASLAVYFSASIEKVDALIKKCEKGRVKDKKFDISKRENAQKFFDLVPYAAIPIISSNGSYNIEEYFNIIGNALKGASTDHLEGLKTIINEVLEGYVKKGSMGTDNKPIKYAADKVKAFNTKYSKGKAITWEDIVRAHEQKFITGELKTKEDYEYSEAFLASIPAGKTLTVYRIGANTEADVDIPEFFSYKASLTQAGVDKAVEILSNGNKGIYNGQMIADILENLRAGVKQASGYCKGMYGHLEDEEKKIVSIIEPLKKEESEDYKSGELIKLVSQTQMVMAKATFENVMSISKMIKTLMAVGNLALDAIKDQETEEKRNNRNGDKDLNLNGNKNVGLSSNASTVTSKAGGALKDIQKSAAENLK